VAKLLETGANDVLVVEPCKGSVDGRERLIPYLPERVVLKVSREDKCITVDWEPDYLA
jgi:16S rRNA processing protein RimM